ncbi:MAG: signal peptidase I [Oscillospiraceae bacterium]|nr:signal peptidase I [Oscillospiraceae bacterium]
MESEEFVRQDASPEEQPAPEQPKKSLFGDILEIVETMLTTLLLFVMLFSYVTRPVTVDGNSMEPTLQDHDRLVMFRLLYSPKQGDIVVVYNSEGHVLDATGEVVNSGYGLHENIIKRVIATEGQTIKLNTDEGLVYVDGQPLEEPYVNDIIQTDAGAFSYPITIPDGYIFVMGDNRNHSTDSRSSYVGLVAEEDVLGKAYFRFCNMQDDEDGKQHPVFNTVGFVG